MRSKSVTLAPIFACGSPDIATDKSTSSPNETHLRKLDVFGIGFHSFQVAPRGPSYNRRRGALSASKTRCTLERSNLATVATPPHSRSTRHRRTAARHKSGITRRKAAIAAPACRRRRRWYIERAAESDVEMLLIVFMLLNATTARPDFTEVQAQVQAHLTRGERLLRDGDYENALWNFQQANTRLSTPIGALGAAECYEQLGDRAYAVYYYRAYLRRAPDARDALEIAERIGDLMFTEAKDGRALLEVESAVAAKGSVDGHSYNAFPIAAFLPPGDHELLVEFPSGPQ